MVMPRQTLFVFPTFNRILQNFTRIIRKKITDIGAILKLLVNHCFSVFLILDDLIIGCNCFSISFSGVTFKPLLKSNMKRKSISYLFLKECPVPFLANKIRLNFRILRNIQYFRSPSLSRFGRHDFSGIKKICNPV